MSDGLVRITEVQATLDPHVQEWIRRALDTGPVDWTAWETSVRACYAAAGIPFPGREVRVPSPIVGTLAAPIAAFTIELNRSEVVRNAANAIAASDVEMYDIRRASRYRTADEEARVTPADVADSEVMAVEQAIQDACVILEELRPAARSHSLFGMVDLMMRGAVAGAVGNAVNVPITAAVHDTAEQVMRAIMVVSPWRRHYVGPDEREEPLDYEDQRPEFHDKPFHPGGEFTDAINDLAMISDVDPRLIGLNSRLMSAAMFGPVEAAVFAALDAATSDVDPTVRAAVRSAIRGAKPPSTSGAAFDLIDQIRLHVDSFLWRLRDGHFEGQHETHGLAIRSFLRNHPDPDVAGNFPDWSRAFEGASTAGWWWPFRDFVMVTERPLVVHVEQVAPTGLGSHRMHCADGPAIAWPDGYRMYFWHGIQVGADLIEGDGWSADRILRETNTEIRRCAIERIGWPRFVEEAGLTLVAAAPDPANPPHQLALYDMPPGLFEVPVRVLLMTNESQERDGQLRHYGETVPAHIDSPLEAAAWQYGVSAETYARMTRRT